MAPRRNPRITLCPLRRLPPLDAWGSSGQIAPAHQEAVDGMGSLPALANGPHHQALAAADIAGREQLWPRLDAIVALVGVEPLEAPARHHAEAELLNDVALHRAGEAHGEEHQVGRQLALAPR